MRDVAQRSGVALATLYKYFASKDELLAAALASWQRQAIPPTAGVGDASEQDPVAHILAYLRRVQDGVDANPEMTALTLQLAMSPEPQAKAAMVQILTTNIDVFARLVDVVAPEDLRHVGFGLSAALAGSLIGLLTGRLDLEQSQSHVEWVARVLLGELQPRTRK